MIKRPTPNQTRKLNKRNRAHLRYHVEVADAHWERMHPDWPTLNSDQRIHRMQKLADQLHSFLCSRRPPGGVGVILTPKGTLRITPLHEASDIVIRSVPTLD